MKPNKLTPGSNVRWESSRMILPEWRAKWLHHQQESKKVDPPMLDEQIFVEYFDLIQASELDKSLLIIEYWEEGFYYEITGAIVRISRQQPMNIKIELENSKQLTIPIEYIRYVGWA
ncbi:YolD-like protein [Marinococcus luteus]|uniref:YolD-like protein n=1 Tax=Marinococcus luteus TaxID=1122204 RepID=A0A1H2YBK8_9BACI|nr:YolD-like family protein [Marinococcus luteus]SDX02054.1 YolD-like protein [Marinococcus luteus]